MNYLLQSIILVALQERWNRNYYIIAVIIMLFSSCSTNKNMDDDLFISLQKIFHFESVEDEYYIIIISDVNCQKCILDEVIYVVKRIQSLEKKKKILGLLFISTNSSSINKNLIVDRTQSMIIWKSTKSLVLFNDIVNRVNNSDGPFLIKIKNQKIEYTKLVEYGMSI